MRMPIETHVDALLVPQLREPRVKVEVEPNRDPFEDALVAE